MELQDCIGATSSVPTDEHVARLVLVILLSEKSLLLMMNENLVAVDVLWNTVLANPLIWMMHEDL